MIQTYLIADKTDNGISIKIIITINPIVTLENMCLFLNKVKKNFIQNIYDVHISAYNRNKKLGWILKKDSYVD